MKKHILLLLAGLSILFSCTEMDSTYEEFIQDGPIVYLSNADSIIGHDGKERIAISWKDINDPRIDFAIVTWNRGQDTVKHIVETGKSDTIFINNLAAFKYAFKICFCSDKGYKSLNKELLLNVYDDSYESFLENRLILDSEFTDGKYKLKFAKASSEIHSTVISWIGVDASQNTKVVTNEEVGCLLSNLEQGTVLSMRTKYLPSPNSVDTFYSPIKKIYIGGDKLKIDVTSGQSSEAQSGFEIAKSYDSNPATYYHSRYGSGTELPLTLEYTLEDVDRLDVIEYTPRDNNKHGTAGNFKEFELWIKTEASGEEYTKIGDYDFAGKGTISSIELEEGILNPKAVKFVVKSVTLKGDGNPAVSCAEMTFYKRPQWWLELNN